MKWLVCILIAIAAFCIGFGAGQGERQEYGRDTIFSTEVHTIIKHDTCSFYYPMPVLCYKTDSIRIGDTILYREHKEYKDSNYTAYISGIDARMDSIFVYPKNIYTERIETRTIRIKPKRWNVGLQAGYGMTPKGFTPYIGLGVSYIFR